VNSTTVALVLLLIILASATLFGRNPALVASFGAMLSFNYFFLPPVRTWHIADPQNLIAWASFTITAIVTGELSASVRRRALESERLYDELQASFKAATQAEAYKQSERLKSALLDAVTHDLRTPLTSIKASVTTLLDSEEGHRTIELDSRGRTEFLDIINEETDRLNRFIEGMVELARIEAGSAASTGSAADVEEIVAAALDRLAEVASHKITLEMSGALPRVRADTRAMAEVFYNLLGNAVKYSGPGSRITIFGEEARDAVLVSVEDEGKGIPPEMREKVFEKFFRLDGAKSGLGLGLAIARGIVEAQNGTITIGAARAGSGTKVTVSLPIARDD
jgi:K+-sensing histidine kinase KdpD